MIAADKDTVTALNERARAQRERWAEARTPQIGLVHTEVDRCFKYFVSYFENEHGEQRVFVRDRHAERAAVYGGDNGWEPVEVYERSPQQLREEMLGAGIRPGALDRMLSLIDPLAPSVILNDSERTWLHNAWHTSGAFGPGDREAGLADLSRSLAAQHAAPAMSKHANSTDYRTAMQTFCRWSAARWDAVGSTIRR